MSTCVRACVCAYMCMCIRVCVCDGIFECLFYFVSVVVHLSLTSCHAPLLFLLLLVPVLAGFLVFLHRHSHHHWVYWKGSVLSFPFFLPLLVNMYTLFSFSFYCFWKQTVEDFSCVIFLHFVVVSRNSSSWVAGRVCFPSLCPVSGKPQAPVLTDPSQLCSSFWLGGIQPGWLYFSFLSFNLSKTNSISL